MSGGAGGGATADPSRYLDRLLRLRGKRTTLGNRLAGRDVLPGAFTGAFTGPAGRCLAGHVVAGLIGPGRHSARCLHPRALRPRRLLPAGPTLRGAAGILLPRRSGATADGAPVAVDEWLAVAAPDDVVGQGPLSVMAPLAISHAS